MLQRFSMGRQMKYLESVKMEEHLESFCTTKGVFLLVVCDIRQELDHRT